MSAMIVGETAAQLFSRLGAKEKLGDLNLPIFNGINLQPRDVVEFCGAEGTAKSELLLNIVAVCIFPKSWHGIRLPGRSVDAVFISTDFKLDLRRLVTIMEAISQSHGVHQTPQTDCKELISSSLSHLHVVMCDSMDELILSLYSLKTFLKNHPEVCALFIDNIGTFWWTDKVESSAGDVVQQRWSTALAELIREFHLIVFAARPLLTKDVTTHLEKATTDEVLYKQWHKLVNLRFFLRKSAGDSTVLVNLSNTHGPTYKLAVTASGFELVS